MHPQALDRVGGTPDRAYDGMTILDALRDTPLTKKALAEAMGCDTRTVEQEVQAARLRSVPIISDSDGYRLAQSAEEVEACAAALRRRAAHQFVTARALRRAARRMRGIVQKELWA